jgi:hypothetical protein
VEGRRFGLEPIRCCAPAPRRGPRQPDVRRQVQDQGEVRLGRAHSHPLERPNEPPVHAAEDSLIDPGGIREPIAQNPRSDLERWFDHAEHVIAAGGGK